MGDLMNGKAPLWKAFLLVLAGSFAVGVFGAILADIPEDQPWILVVAQSAVLAIGVVVVVSAWRCALNTPTPILGWLLRFWLVATVTAAIGGHYHVNTEAILFGKREEAAPIDQPRDIMREQLELAIRNPAFMDYIERMVRGDRAMKSGAENTPMPESLTTETRPITPAGEYGEHLNRMKLHQDREDIVINAFTRAYKASSDEWAAMLKKGEAAGMSRELMEQFPAEAERRAKWDAANRVVR